MKTAFDEYLDELVASGLDAQQADAVVRARKDKRNTTKSGAIRMEKKDNEAELLLYDVIGFDFWTGGGITPKKLVDELEAMKPFDKLTIRVNSPGGDVFDGMTIFNILRRQEAKVCVEIEGLAASAASFIVQVADAGELRISEAGMMMCHRAWGICMGNTNDMLELASVLDKLDGQIADIYAGRTKRKADTWLKIMDDETWFTGQEAVEAKLADETITTKRAAALYDPSVVNQFRNAPKDLAARLAEIAKDDKPEQKPSNLKLASKARVRVLDLEEVTNDPTT